MAIDGVDFSTPVAQIMAETQKVLSGQEPDMDRANLALIEMLHQLCVEMAKGLEELDARVRALESK